MEAESVRLLGLASDRVGSAGLNCLLPVCAFAAGDPESAELQAGLARMGTVRAELKAVKAAAELSDHFSDCFSHVWLVDRQNPLHCTKTVGRLRALREGLKPAIIRSFERYSNARGDGPQSARLPLINLNLLNLTLLSEKYSERQILSAMFESLDAELEIARESSSPERAACGHVQCGLNPLKMKKFVVRVQVPPESAVFVETWAFTQACSVLSAFVTSVVPAVAFSVVVEGLHELGAEQWRLMAGLAVEGTRLILVQPHEAGLKVARRKALDEPFEFQVRALKRSKAADPRQTMDDYLRWISRGGSSFRRLVTTGD